MELEDPRQALRLYKFLSLHCKKEEILSSCRVVFKTWENISESFLPLPEYCKFSVVAVTDNIIIIHIMMIIGCYGENRENKIDSLSS